MARSPALRFLFSTILIAALGGVMVGHGGQRGSLPFFYDVYSFRGPDGQTDVVAAFTVRTGELDRERVDGTVRYRFNVTLVLADTVRGGVSRADDSVFVAFDRSPSSDHLLHTHVETRARPSASTALRVVMIDAPDPGTGQLYTEPYEVPDYSGRRMMLSDLALGLPEPRGGWSRRGRTLTLLPGNYLPGGLFDVYYEVYNLPEGRPYSTEMSLQALDRDGHALDGTAPIRVQFEDEAVSGADDTVVELRRVDAPLEEGAYRMTITVTDLANGRTAVRSRHITVREWEEGATLVATCPIRKDGDICSE